MSSDRNAIQLPLEEDHIGHVNKEIAAVLSLLMDLSSQRSAPLRGVYYPPNVPISVRL